jgi:hydroxymethylbilane synthase
VKPLRIGTRGSALALWQANHIAQHLAQLQQVQTEIVRIRTSGDHLQSASPTQADAALGTKGIFIKEIEDALLAGAIDLAVHSMKDVPTQIPRGLEFPAITKREDARDCLISRGGHTLKELPPESRIGTSSLRRQAQLRHHRHDLHMVDLRGNVDTRLKKLDSGELDAIVVAAAGVTRLGLAHRITQMFDEEYMLPAVGQGALGIETRSSDPETSAIVARLDDLASRSCITAERALLHELQGGCQVPLGAWAHLSKGELHLEAAVFSVDGREFARCDESGDAADPDGLGARLGKILIEAGADRILRLVGRTAAGEG